MKHVITLLVGFLFASAALAQPPALDSTVSSQQITGGPVDRHNQADPIALLLGSWADPSILRVGDDYYMTQSTCGGYIPSMLVWHSRDLLDWTPLGYVHPDREAGLAPDLACVDGTYYLYYDRVRVATAESPKGPWTDHGLMPKARGIDPGHFVDSAGKRHMYTYQGLYTPLSDDGLRCLAEPKQVYTGWPIPKDWAFEGHHLESPKMFRRGDWYYMVSAQGGTFGPMCGHMAVVARSNKPEGPWENSPHNPIIRTWDPTDPWWTTGHATIFQGPGNHWFAVYHGYKNGYRLLGRSTLMLPIMWTEDDWPVVAAEWPAGFNEEAVNIRLPLSDEFNGPKIGLQWQSPGRHDRSRYRFQEGTLVVRGEGDGIGNSHPLTENARHIAYQIETEVQLDGADSAGLVIYYNSEVFVGVGLTKKGIIKRSYKAGKSRPYHNPEFKFSGDRVKLRMINDKNDLRCFYQDSEGEWVVFTSSTDISFMSDNGFNGNSSMRPGIYATGGGDAVFSYFRYTPYENRQYERHFGKR